LSSVTFLLNNALIVLRATPTAYAL